MTISIDYSIFNIFVPRADLVEVQNTPSFVYQLNLEWFYRQVADLQDDQAGAPFETAVENTAPVNVGGVVLARVIQVINGYTVEFEDGQYAVNLTAANTNLQDVAIVNQVSIRPSNSAGLQDLSTLLTSAYNSTVYVDVANGQPGTVIPLGTRQFPSNNLDDAVAIANNNSLSTISFLNSTTLADTDFSAGYKFTSDSLASTILTINPAAQIAACSFQDIQVTGTLDGMNDFVDCIIGDIFYTNGTLRRCGLAGTIYLGGGSQCTIVDCYSNISGGGVGQFVSIDMGGNGNSLAMRGYAGGANISNWDGTSGAVSIDLNSGRIIVANTVTGGVITIRGVGDVVDNSTGTAVVQDLTINNSLDEIAVMTEQQKVQEIWKILGLDPVNIQTITDTSIDVDGISITITRDEQAGSTTVDRQ
jgi:hypothetical protein